jgi:hypothetical protein
MKLLLVNDLGESVACFEDVERYDVQNSSNVLALLDFLETLIAAAKGSGEAAVQGADRFRSKVGSSAQGNQRTGGVRTPPSAVAQHSR